MKKTMKSWLIALVVGLLAGPSSVFAAASGNYTDLLPIGAAANTTVISNGTGWSLATLPPTTTFGDSLSRVVTTVFQSTTTTSVNATMVTSTVTAISSLGKVGSTTFPATWVASGRSIRVKFAGNYSTPNLGAISWIWAVKLGTTTILTSSATAMANQVNAPFSAEANIVVAGTGAGGTALGNYQILAGSGTSTAGLTTLLYSTQTASAVSVDWTSQLTVNPTITWGMPNSSMTVTNATVEFLN